MNFHKTIIIDDEPLAIDVITHHLKRFSNIEVIKTFTDSVEAFNFLKEGHKIDIVFTDIAMPEISGIELVKLSKGNTKFIITTSYSEYAVESFDLEVVDYLLKPISFERFCKAITRFEILENSENQKTLEPSFFVKEGDEFIKILVKDIDYIEGLKDYAKIFTGNNYCLALKTLKSIEAILSPYKFMRIHKSYIVPLSKISQYNGKCILVNNIEIPIGRNYKEALKIYLNNNKL
ncbi:response regulator transcription factor [Subsaximicrobium wynnwilliamsii]|uniref:Response regulator transcription factor n=1 Tax=Subsaximicrobium wynnwilliamsii TaxID=291179 RepID=A0A5C6ZHR9_9FLAO|nr:LytTR family DNA-binding domain-containing protein [Subsaximicrobium wynnwilliamsii]TXD83434.1 response regulator transcription factor [Subsaximicrobium wynnwilliamsii]TXD89291.1 response regulator transcription factor [Subsaximicrobium wynnwilliamsii]TXE03114.1 response regulator transcription factor [Subsaximicrobium wynnwilliamsii]